MLFLKIKIKKLKAYVPYNVTDVRNDVFTARDLYRKTIEKDIAEKIKQQHKEVQNLKK